MLVNCVAYRHGKKLESIEPDEISDHLRNKDSFVWVALRDATEDELAKMQEEFGLHDLAVDDARKGHERPKIEEYDDVLFAVMQVPALKGGRLEIGELDVFAGQNFVLSLRSRGPEESLGVRDRAEREPKLLAHGAGFVLYALMDAIVDRYFPIIVELERELEKIEDQIFRHASARNNVERLYALKRKVTALHHGVAPLVEAVGKLCSGRVPNVCVKSSHYFRDVYDHVRRIDTSLGGIRDTIVTAIQVTLSMVTIEDAETTKRLAAWAGLFGIATAFAGIWGMNFAHMPELDWRYGYPAALLAIGVACGALYTRFRRAGWL
jgi:magnesium transporter